MHTELSSMAGGILSERQTEEIEVFRFNEKNNEVMGNEVEKCFLLEANER